MSFDKKKLAVVVLAVILGFIGEVFNKTDTTEPLAVIKEQCEQGAEGLEPYEGLLGGETLTCMLVQFFYTAITTRDWLFALPNLVGCNFVVSIVVVVETVRTNSFFVKVPFLCAFLGQYLGFGFAYPLLWIPFYVYGKATTAATEAHPGRMAVAWFYGASWLVLLILMVNVFDQGTYAWGVVASIISGPCVALPLLLVHVFPKKASCSAKTSSPKGSSIIPNLSKHYIAASVVSFVLWVITVHGLCKALPNLRPSTIIDALYTSGTWASKFLIVDFSFLFLALLLYIFNEGGIKHVGLATLLVLPVGPGAATGLTLALISKEESEKELDTMNGDVSDSLLYHQDYGSCEPMP